MNIIEAIKSGRPFRRNNEDGNLWLTPLDPVKDGCFQFLLADILADDWEVESASVTITREQFNAAWDKALDDSAVRGFNCLALHHCLTKELGL
jgi:hypothetical protein